MSDDKHLPVADEPTDKLGARRRKAKELDEPKTSAAKGPMSPAQYEDDGWGQTPVQMRG